MAQTNLEKRWEQASLNDDFIFSKVFLDPMITKEMIHRVLPELPLGKVTILNSQQELTSTYDAKGAASIFMPRMRTATTMTSKCRSSTTKICHNERAFTSPVWQMMLSTGGKTTARLTTPTLYSYAALIPLVWENNATRSSDRSLSTQTTHIVMARRPSSLTLQISTRRLVRSFKTFWTSLLTAKLMRQMPLSYN